MILTQEYLRKASLNDLKDSLHISYKCHSKYPNLIGLKYNQFSSPADNPIVQECRGLILDSNDNWKVIAYPFNRFFNHGEKYASNIDWKHISAQEKLDGTLIILYFYNNEWNIATSGTPDASGQIGNSDITFNDYFWSISEQLGMSKSWMNSNLLHNVCYMFELTGNLNKVVVSYKEPNLTLIGARDLLTYKEICIKEIYDLFSDTKINFLKEYCFNNINDIIKTFENISPVEQEGYVIVDKQFQRIKVKNPKYILMHNMKSSISLKNILDTVRKGEYSEFISVFPEYKKEFDDIDEKYKNLIIEVKNNFEKIKHISSRKEFAFEANKTICPSALFCKYSNKISSFEEHFFNINIDYLLKLI